MTQTAKTQEERLAQAIASIEERDGYCLVASESESDKHVVTYNENFYATYCTCVGHSQYGADCYHMNAVDRHFDDRRPDFYTMHGIQKLAKQQVEKPAVASEDETVEVMVGNTRIVAARRNIENAVSHHQWGIDVVAAVEGGKSEARYFEQKRALDEQYSKAPSAWELSETQASEMRAFYNGL